MMNKEKRVFILSFLLVFSMVENAYAYLDPGTGSMLLQGLIAAFFAGITAVGIYWRRLKSFFSRFRNKGDNN